MNSNAKFLREGLRKGLNFTNMSGSSQIWGGGFWQNCDLRRFFCFFSHFRPQNRNYRSDFHKKFSLDVSGYLVLNSNFSNQKFGRKPAEISAKMAANSDKICDFHVKQTQNRSNMVLNTCAHLIPANINTPTCVEVLLDNKNVTFQVGGYLSFWIKSIFCVKICDFHVKQPRKIETIGPICPKNFLWTYPGIWY